jgi:hypothetical protein
VCILGCKPQGYLQRFAYPIHDLRAQCADALPETALIKGADLFGEYNAVLLKSRAFAGYRYMGGQARLVHLSCDRKHDHRRTVPVSDVVLYDQHGADAALFRTYDRVQTGGVQIASGYHEITLRIHGMLHRMRMRRGP